MVGCSCIDAYRCHDCNMCYVHSHEVFWQASDADDDMGTYTWYGVDDVLDFTGLEYVTVGSGCCHRVRFET